MNLDIDGKIIRITHESFKEGNTVCKDTCISTLMYLSHLLIGQTQKILQNAKITGLNHLKPEHHWDLMLKMVFRQYLFILFH